VLALSAALIAIVTPAIAGFVGGPLGTAIDWLRLPVAGLAMMLLWALLYYVLPDVQQKFKFITPGSVGGVILWVAASAGFSAYVSNFGKYDATYGSLGGIIVLLLWMWISSLVMLLGAEANAIIEHHSYEGKRAGAKSLADSGPSDSKRKELGPTSPRQATEDEEEGRGRGDEHRSRRGAGRGAPARSRGADRQPPRFSLASIAGLFAAAMVLKRVRA
jgi:membrane protein